MAWSREDQRTRLSTDFCRDGKMGPPRELLEQWGTHYEKISKIISYLLSSLFLTFFFLIFSPYLSFSFPILSPQAKKFATNPQIRGGEVPHYPCHITTHGTPLLSSFLSHVQTNPPPSNSSILFLFAIFVIILIEKKMKMKNVMEGWFVI